MFIYKENPIKFSILFAGQQLNLHWLIYFFDTIERRGRIKCGTYCYTKYFSGRNLENNSVLIKKEILVPYTWRGDFRGYKRGWRYQWFRCKVNLLYGELNCVNDLEFYLKLSKAIL